ncbi:MAG: hypothetical protein H6741_10420 [Alphaproteobacteria bacterium]|nr:hypothetical protein [Alphaproteobacteria bacterium]
MTRALLLTTITLVAIGCGGKDSSGDDTAPGDTQPSSHPLVPPGYEYRWDIDGCGDSGTAAMNYKLGEASTDADGNITITERSFTFYGGDWSNDCMDVLSFTGTSMSGAEINDFGASEAEEGYQVIRSIAENNCGGNYTEDLEAWFIFDTLSPSGNLNVDNAMLVFYYYEGRRGITSDLDYARGVFNPEDTSELGPPATYTWEYQNCQDGSW